MKPRAEDGDIFFFGISIVLKLTFAVDLHTKTNISMPCDRHQADISANLGHRQSVGHDGVLVKVTGEDLQ